MNKTLKNRKGITLVSLVVTIIILLILAGITINSLTDNGLFKKAKLAKEKSENAEKLENEILGDYENNINEYIYGSNRNITSEYRVYETKMPTTSGLWTKILDGKFDEDNDYIIGYKIYTDGIWQQHSSIGQNVVTFSIKEDGIYSYCGYKGCIGQNVKLVISNFKK